MAFQSSAGAHGELHQISNLSEASLDDLRSIIRTFPVIDNHAHNLLKPEKAYGSADIPLEQFTSEAHGDALAQGYSSTLAHIRAVKQLAQLYSCEESWPAVKRARDEHLRRDYHGLIKICFEGTHSILMDDGLDATNVQPFDWHNQFIPGHTHRIVRIEAVAAEVLEKLVTETGWHPMQVHGDSTSFGKDGAMASIGDVAKFFFRFHGAFAAELQECLNSSDVKGFKSVVCYRTGLDVEMTSKLALSSQAALTRSDLLNSFHRYLEHALSNGTYRVQEKALNDYLVVALCEVLQNYANGKRAPFQFHTGLGDNDINLIKSNPAYLQPLIAAYPAVDFVLLHSSYPYTREAGYLAATYLNAYLDIGEVFPMLSRDGEETVLRQALELTPSSKILWSTDGHFFPETYWLANKQFRQALEKVLTAGVELGDYSVVQAVNLAVDIMFWNSDQVYGLDEGPKHPHLLAACGRATGTSTPPASNVAKMSTLSTRTPSRTTSIKSAPGTTATKSSLLAAFLAQHPDLRYIWLQFVDYTNTFRHRFLPIAEFVKLVDSGRRIGVSKSLVRLSQDDNIVEGGTATGQILLEPDLSSLCCNVGIPSKSASVQTFWQESDGSAIEGCPRSTLQHFVAAAKEEFDIEFLVGFEIEIAFVRPFVNEAGERIFLPWHQVHNWSAVTFEMLDALPMIEETVEALAGIGIHLPTFHAESAPGQWEFVLPPSSPLEAVDCLYKARQTIQHIAKSHGLKATVYPRPYPDTCGSASHAHFSLSPLDHESSFLAGIMEHLSATLAFSLPHVSSYERVAAGIWAGGEWVGWGTQNREMPLRKIEPGHYELKTVDGLANMYLAMATILGSGLQGIRTGQKLVHKDCPIDASTVSQSEREKYGITDQLPSSLEQALAALEADEALQGLLGTELCGNYIAVRKAEAETFRSLSPERARTWLMERH